MVPFCKIVTSQPECVLICAGVNIKFYTLFLIWVIPLLPQSRHWSVPTPQVPSDTSPVSNAMPPPLATNKVSPFLKCCHFKHAIPVEPYRMISFPHSAQLPGSSRWPCMYPQLSPLYCQVVFHGTATSVCLTLHPHLLIQKEGSSAPSLSVKNRTYFSKLILYAHAIKFIAQQKCTEWKVGLTSIPHPSPQRHPVSVCASYDYPRSPGDCQGVPWTALWEPWQHLWPRPCSRRALD